MPVSYTHLDVYKRQIYDIVRDDVPVKQVFVSAEDIKDALLQKKEPEP